MAIQLNDLEVERKFLIEDPRLDFNALLVDTYGGYMSSSVVRKVIVSKVFDDAAQTLVKRGVSLRWRTSHSGGDAAGQVAIKMRESGDTDNRYEIQVPCKFSEFRHGLSLALKHIHASDYTKLKEALNATDWRTVSHQFSFACHRTQFLAEDAAVVVCLDETLYTAPTKKGYKSSFQIRREIEHELRGGFNAAALDSLEQHTGLLDHKAIKKTEDDKVIFGFAQQGKLDNRVLDCYYHQRPR